MSYIVGKELKIARSMGHRNSNIYLPKKRQRFLKKVLRNNADRNME